VKLECDPKEIVKTLEVFRNPDQVVEIRAIVDKGTFKKIWSGYFDWDHLKEIPKVVNGLGAASGIYFTLNPVDPSLLARAFNRLREVKNGESSGDGDILQRDWVLFDFDAVRKSGISATDAEKAEAFAVARKVAEYLKGLGWPDPIKGDSGNGGHLYYRVDLPVKDGGLLQRCLKALAHRFSTPSVGVDTSVHNSGQITKLFGSPVRKGDDTPDRPHRMARLRSVPDQIEVVPVRLLEELAAEVAPDVVAEPPARSNRKIGSFDVDEWLETHGLTAGLSGWEPCNGGERRVWHTCPMNSDHQNRSAIVFRGADGHLGFKCHHNSCQNYHWKDLRAKYEPSKNHTSTGSMKAEEAGNRPIPGDVVGDFDAPENLIAYSWMKNFRGHPVPEVEYLVRPLVPRVALGIVASQTGHGKSTSILQLCVALATGLPFMGRPVEGPCGTGMLCLEDSLATVHARMEAAVASYGSQFTEEHHRLLDANFKILMKRPRELLRLKNTARWQNLADLVYDLGSLARTTEAPLAFLAIDTLNAVHDGDENSNTEARPLVAAVEDLAEALGCSIYLLHHYRKTGIGKFEPSLADRMDLDLIRGAGAITCTPRAVFQFAWVTRKEALRAGISDWKWRHQYAIVALTKISGGVPSDWELWKHGNGGLFEVVPGGAEMIARMLGQEMGAGEPVTNRDKVLLALLEAMERGSTFDRKALASTLCVGAPDPAASLRATLANLRKDDLVTPRDELTPKGMKRAKALAKDCIILDSENVDEPA